MRKKGSRSEFIEDRDRELMTAIRHKAMTMQPGSTSEIYGEAASQRCSRFWVSERRAAFVIGQMMRNPDFTANMLPLRRAMFNELFSRVTEIMCLNPGISISAATFEAVNSEAPEFYLTSGSAAVIASRNRTRSKRRVV